MEAKTATLIMLDKPILVNEELTKEQAQIIPHYQNHNKQFFKIIAGHEGTKRLTFNLCANSFRMDGYLDVEKIVKEMQGLHPYCHVDSMEKWTRVEFEETIKIVNTILSLTPKKYTEEDMMDFLEFIEFNYYPHYEANDEGGYIPKGYWCKRGGIDTKDYSRKELFEIFLKQRQPQQFKVEYTETETEINVTKIL